MAEFPTEDEIVQAVERSGYLMEQDVATRFEQLGYNIETNNPFEDIEQGKSREVDVRAFKRITIDETRKIAANFEFIVECKNNSAPTVFIGRDKSDWDNSYHRRPEFCFPHEEYIRQKSTGPQTGLSKYVSPFEHLGFDQVHYRVLEPQKAVQFCRIERAGKKWRADHGGLYDSIFYPMAKALSSRRKELPKHNHVNDWRYIWFFFPLVVMNAEILYIDSSLKPTRIEKRDYVSFSRRIESSNLKDRYTIDFVQAEALERFHTNCIAPLERHVKDLVDEKIDFLLQKELPWIDD